MSNKWIGFQMKEALKLVAEDGVETNIVPTTGRKDGPTDWLTPMVTGTTFLSSHYDYIYEYTLMAKSVSSLSLLRRNSRQGIKDTSDWFWCHNHVFCSKNNLIKELHD